jgi:hypothetical protein
VHPRVPHPANAQFKKRVGGPVKIICAHIGLCIYQIVKDLQGEIGIYSWAFVAGMDGSYLPCCQGVTVENGRFVDAFARENLQIFSYAGASRAIPFVFNEIQLPHSTNPKIC